MKKLYYLLTVGALFVLMAPVQDCPNGFVNITYHQVGACNGGPSSDGEYNAGPNQAYVVFAIESIDNSQNQNAFAYDPSNIYWIDNSKDAFDSSLEIYTYVLGPFATVPTTVNAGSSLNFSPYGFGALIVQTVAMDGASEANNTSYFLGYQGSGSGTNPIVLLTKSDSSQTSWPDTPNCSDIILARGSKTKAR
jgi:hypothetical protein